MSRDSRLQDLKQATDDYVKSEKDRLSNEVQYLKAVLQGRTGGAGIQANSVAVVQAVAEADLATFLRGA